MYNGEYHTERLYQGKPIIIDLARLPGLAGPIFEVMAMTERGHELECTRHFDFQSAEASYKRMLMEYPESCAPLFGKYAKLRDDLRVAIQKGQMAEFSDPEDGGTCNHDAPSLILPRWDSVKVAQAAQEAGTRCFPWKLFGSRRFVFAPNTRAQGNARVRNAEAMCESLSKAGYDCVMYCQMD